ncbi:hypothetical protein BOX15_Mlig026441g1 [Macrostomum lignano]|uniref:Uncharacterized protein n=2 Tax=Macrostomum lignano TaxID=282301 RepID=A0A267FCH8_9PLAT|nr:hypothetical protein BOX15_Mlig030445g1 [Macrostomum lignano]PAA71490.1 hypothetical protein BOX15_Mlig026441g1 [Macrostomum lignano]
MACSNENNKASPSDSSATGHRRVLIALDGSPLSEHAFQWYLANVRREGDLVIAAHILEPPSLPSFSLKKGFSVPADDWREIILANGRAAKQMEEDLLLRAANLKLKLDFIAESHKRPGEALVDIAWRSGCHLVIMATRGLSDVRRAFLGSVSEHVMRHSNLPVCIVPKPPTADSHEAAGSAAAKGH